MRAVRTIVVASLTGIALIVGVSLVAASPAFAYPQNCGVREYFSGHGGWAGSGCSGGSGSHRVRISCDRLYTTDIIRYGPWKGTSETSYASCRSNEIIQDAWVQTQGD